MTNGPLLGAMLNTTVAGSTVAAPRSRLPRRQRFVRRPLAVCAALVISVTLAIAAGFASSAIAGAGVVGGGPTINGTAEATAEPTHGPTINGTDEATAEGLPNDPAADGDDTPWALVVIGTGLALGAIGVGISGRLNHTRTSPAAPSVSDT
jgi:hypothetical protein